MKKGVIQWNNILINKKKNYFIINLCGKMLFFQRFSSRTCPLYSAGAVKMNLPSLTSAEPVFSD